MKADLSDILLPLYRNLGRNPPWTAFLAALAAHAGASAAHLVLQDESGQLAQFGTGILPIETAQLARMRYLRAYSPDDFSAAQPFRAMRLRCEGGGEAWIALSRQGGDLAAAVSLLLGHLAPHLALAARQYWTEQHLSEVAAGMNDMAQRLGIAWAKVSATAMLLAGHNVPTHYHQSGRLRLPSPAQKRVLAALEAGEAAAINLPDMQLFLAQAARQSDPAMLYFVRPAAPPPQAAPLLAQLFDVTPAEARFAARLAQGDSIEAAGQHLGLTAQTARYYSKQLYPKLAASGLPDAVRKIANSVYRLF